MDAILKTVAEGYSRRYKNLKDICFIFPNKRCGVFFNKYLTECGIDKKRRPYILTISEFMSQLAGKKEAGKIEQLFILYNCYLKILKDDTKIEFEEFRNWGETVLSDFNTVDMYMVTPEEIFKNVKDYREISSNFLTDDQKEVMREYFGIEDFGDASKFWKDFKKTENNSELKKSFLNLWQVLTPLHSLFKSTLDKKKIGTTGLIYREAANKILQKGKDALNYKKVVAVGFNALTESERVIFRELRDSEPNEEYGEMIDFVWDGVGPVLTNKEFSASRFVLYNKKHFPMPDWLETIIEKDDNKEWPEIDIISAPSNTAQTKIAGEILRNYDNEEGRLMMKEAEVALVLPDEILLSNLLFSFPDNLPEINLTMGLSIKQTQIASFMYLLRRVYASMREGKNENSFYSKDLSLLLSHPYIYTLTSPEKLEALKNDITKYHKISVKFEEKKSFLEDDTAIFNFPSKNGENIAIFRYLEELFSVLKEKLTLSDRKSLYLQDLEEIDVYREYVFDLEKAVKEYGISLNPIATLQLIDRLIGGGKIGFEGEPLTGLQVMGTLETRSLDFPHLIILSMNEGIMPRRSQGSTFIPETLRKAYGLPPARYAEEIFGYYFYRLLSRAKKVSLIFDGRAVTGMRGGESRYLLQLKEYAPKDKIRWISRQYKFTNKEEISLNVKKTEEIMEMLSAYCMPGEGRRYLSASTLNNYRECEVKFFLQNLLRLNTDPAQGDFMDAITVGDILHEVMMDLYIPEKTQQRKLLKDPILMTESKLQGILGNPSLIESLIRKKIRKLYFKDKEDENNVENNSGVIDLMREQIGELVREIVNYDKKLAPFFLYGCEIEKDLRVKLRSGKEVNFKFAIDRLDALDIKNGQHKLRIVDYKTGSRKRRAANLEEVFKGGYGNEQIFQLFVYAWLLGKIGFKGWEEVVTEIYFVPDLIKGTRGLPEIGGKKVESFKNFKDEFSSHLEEMIEGIFISKEFVTTKDIKLCAMCGFKTLCKK